MGEIGLILFALAGSAIQLVPDGTILFHLALIVVMVALLNATLLKPLNRVLEERDRQTKGRAGEARAALARVEERMQEYERKLREARGAGYALLDRERAAASQERERRIASIKAEVGEQRSFEKEKLGGAETKVKASLAADAQQRAVEISGRILGRHIG
jgi:F-type H+-transporting ATPase subunit b